MPKQKKIDRAAFERWAASWIGATVYMVREQQCDDDAYADPELDLAWSAWQEAAKRACPKSPAGHSND